MPASIGASETLSVATSPLDDAFGRFVARLAGEPHKEVLHHTARLVSAERAQGHSCIELPHYADRQVLLGGGVFRVPNLEHWMATLRASGVCTSNPASPHADTLFVLDQQRLYLTRYFAAEWRVAASIRARTARAMVVQADGLDDRFAALFPRAATGDDWQAVAASTALRRALTFVTGGPGTGKTTVVARILALLLHAAPECSVAIAAPTGRAAARLVESIGAASEREQLPDRIRQQLPTTGATLHRLLGYQPWTETFRHGPAHPLPHDVVVIDEASMVDILMMDTLLAALRDDTRVIILGDPNQLASVDTGFVLGDVVRAATDAPPASALAHSVVRLRHSWRFGNRPGIGALAQALQRGDADDALTVLRDASHDDVTLVPWSTRAILRASAASLDALLACTTPVDALQALARFRVLTATREGPRGVIGINQVIERELAARGLPHTGWYPYRPVLITSNDPGLGLFNGDVGIAFRDATRLTVYFPQPDGSVRAIAPSRLPAHETAWAMTIHKSQGSEFDTVLLVLPEQDVPILTRELLYTGVTRARQHVQLLGDVPMLTAATQRSVGRTSGLVDRLLAPPMAAG